MKIVDSKCEVMFDKSGIDMLKNLERIGRICYESEDRITDDSYIKFIGGIVKRGHLSVIEHESVTFYFQCDRAVSHELVRHRISSFCLAGDSIIYSTGQKKWTIKELFDWSKDSKKSSRLSMMNIRSVNENNNTIIKNKIVGIYFNGNRPVYELVTESGRKIKVTSNHQFYTPNGYISLDNLSVGDYVYANGLELLENPDWLKTMYLDKNYTRSYLASMIGCCESILNRAFKKFGIKKPKSQYPNRKGGRGHVGMFSDEALKKLSADKLGENNPQWLGDGAGGYIKTHRTYNSANKSCEFCGAINGIEIHHMDKNIHNIEDSNIKFLCSKCHKLWHKAGSKGIFRDKIVSISFVGNEDVYDLEMQAPFHNFVSNGLVVHNCQQSQRYVKFDDVEVIRPSQIAQGTNEALIWEHGVKVATDVYKSLIEKGMAPQNARSVLPNATATKIYATMNLRALRNFIELRCEAGAHPDIRILANQLLEKLHSHIPIVFDDLYEKFIKKEPTKA